MTARLVTLLFAILLALPSPTPADPCDSPWAQDYRRQPGPWELEVGGETIDSGFYRQARIVVLLGRDDDGPWLRTYRFEAPVTVEMVAERRDLTDPRAVEVVDDRVFLLDDGTLRELALGTAGSMEPVGALELTGAPRLLAVRGDRAWASGDAVIHQIDVANPGSPMLVRSAQASIAGAKTLRSYGDRAWLLGFEVGALVMASVLDGELTVRMVAYTTGGQFTDVGFTPEGDALFALELFDGLWGTGGALVACQADDPLLVHGVTWSGCGQDIPSIGNLRVTHQISEDPRGFLASRKSGGYMTRYADSWALHSAQPGETTQLQSGMLRSRPREMAYLGDYLVGRTGQGLFVVAPELGGDSPVLSVMDVPSSRGLATDGTIVAAGAATRVQMIDASDPRSPQLGGFLDVDRVDWLDFVEGDELLYMRREGVVSAWDLTDLAQPRLVRERSVNPGTAIVGRWEGETALFTTSGDSLTLQVWTGPAQPAELLRQWDLAEPMVFREIAPPIAGGPGSFVRLDEPEPLVPRLVWEGGLGDPTAGPPLRPVAFRYRPTLAITQNKVQVYSIHLDRCPVTTADHRFLPVTPETYMIPATALLGDQIWIAMFGRIAVGAVDGPEEGTLWSLLSPQDLGVDVDFAEIAATDRFTVIGGVDALSFLAPHCPESSLPVSTLVSTFEITRTAAGCAAIRFAADHALDLYRRTSAGRTRIDAAGAGSGFREAEDCPGSAATYELADVAGVIYASREFSPDLARKRASVVARPNPFNPRTVIEFVTPGDGPVRLEVFDTRGRSIRTLADEVRTAGRYFEEWDGTDTTGSAVGAGVYFIRLRAPGATEVVKVGLVK